MRRAKDPTERGFDRYDKRRLTKALQGIEDVRTYRRAGDPVARKAGWSQRLPKLSGAAMGRLCLGSGLPPEARSWLSPGRPAVGRPRTAPAITNKRIEREVRRDPMRLGYSTTGWTVALLAEHLQRKYDVAISPRTLRRRMRDLDLRWKRPRYVYATKDPNRAQKKGGLFAA
jgi:transposase